MSVGAPAPARSGQGAAGRTDLLETEFCLRNMVMAWRKKKKISIKKKKSKWVSPHSGITLHKEKFS